MPPIFSTASILSISQTQALEHGALFFGRIVVILTSAESTCKVVVVLVVRGRDLPRNTTGLVGGWVQAKSARGRSGQSCGATVTDKVSFGEELNKVVLSMAGNATRVADGCGSVCSVVGLMIWRRIAGQAGKERLAKRTEWAGAGVELLQYARQLGASLGVCDENGERGNEERGDEERGNTRMEGPLVLRLRAVADWK